MVEPVIPSTPAALAGAGLFVNSDPSGGDREIYVVTGKTYDHKETLKAHGGRWSKSRGAWVFDDAAMIQRLCVAFGCEDVGAGKPGFAEAPMQFQPSLEAGQPQKPHCNADKRGLQDYHGHRKRLRDRFTRDQGESMADYELLELLLFFSIRYVDVKPLAKHLLSKFGSLSDMLAADPRRIDEVIQSIDTAAGDRIRRDSYFTVIHLKAMRRLLERVLEEGVVERPVISSWQALLDYLKVALGREPIEQFRLLFLDKKNILLEDKNSAQPFRGWDEKQSRVEELNRNKRSFLDRIQQRGTVDHTPLYPREIAKRALELGASAVIMVHNHPSGDPTPSRADIEMTKQVEAALAPIRVALHDHLIIGKDRHLSFKSEGLL